MSRVLPVQRPAIGVASDRRADGTVQLGASGRISLAIAFDGGRNLSASKLVERDERIWPRVGAASDEDHVVWRTASLNRGLETSDNSHCATKTPTTMAMAPTVIEWTTRR